ncbi:helix-turn-helix transcriptional regulator [Actinokineospora enzanensis]|uniref:helix-turn-helix transcriptional regulator n=1 Tax=Actinokineospora enzanensis TaxID=155975 RepID=UPI000476D9AC|nr:LuxR family transcriptional regulator [Actinokineospora enzanensis]
MFLGRTVELAAIGRLIGQARHARGSALVLRGAAGIGKSALLTTAAATAPDTRLLRVVGVESESTLTYAALHQLLLPVRDRVDSLPDPQADALRVAFGLASGPPTQPFLVSVAALTLLSELAVEKPLLIVIDDAQWCDAASQDAFAFVGRRLEAEAITMLLAVRDDTGRDIDAAGLRQLHLTGLDDATAAELLGDRVSAALLPTLVRDTGGNPLALLELADRLDGDGLPLTGRLERAFLDRIHRIGPDAAMLLVAAAAGTSGIAAVERAAGYLGVDPGVLRSPEVSDLVRLEDDALSFRHPLVLSALYGSAPPDTLRAVHDALARALADDPTHAERRAWHRAKASAGPDEEVAIELERSATEALHRSGYLAAAAALERAAELSHEVDARARRLTDAAKAAWRGGDTTTTLALLDRVRALSPGGTVGLEAQYLRGSVELRAGSPAESVSILVPAARQAVSVDPTLALKILLLAREAVFTAAHPEAMDALAQSLRSLPELNQPADRQMAFLLDTFLAPHAAHHHSVTAALVEVESSDDPELLLAAGGMAWAVGEYGLSARLRARAVARARALGAAGTLALTLEYLVPDEISRARYAAAEALADEGLRLAEETGRRNSASLHLALLSTATGLRGRGPDARRMAEQALSEAVPRRLVKVADVAQRSLGLLALAECRSADALVAFSKLDGSGPVPGSPVMAVSAVPDHVEAAVRAGAPEVGERLVGRYLSWAESVGSAELTALASRSQALVAGSAEEASGHYREALRLHALADRPFDHARTELLYGEFLRRGRHRGAARGYLRSAMDAFARLGTPIWAERARAELRAAGESVGGVSVGVAEGLTPQEMQVARAVGRGATNREVAAEMFISPRTVDYHLRKIFRKLDISSRRDLMKLNLDSHH